MGNTTIFLTGAVVQNGLKVLSAAPTDESKAYILSADEETRRKISISALHTMFRLGYNDNLKETGCVAFLVKEYFGLQKYGNSTFYTSAIVRQLTLLKKCKGYIEGKEYDVISGYSSNRGVFRVMSPYLQALLLFITAAGAEKDHSRMYVPTAVQTHSLSNTAFCLLQAIITSLSAAGDRVIGNGKWHYDIGGKAVALGYPQERCKLYSALKKDIGALNEKWNKNEELQQKYGTLLIEQLRYDPKH